MEFDINSLTKSYIWSTFSKVSQVTALMQRMNCNQSEGNSQTIVRQDGSNIVDAYYHGNLIASLDKTNYENEKLKIYNQNYFTKTTKDRLNAILHLHTNGKVRIVVVKGKWIVRDSNTDAEINFYEGMVIFQKPLSLSQIETGQIEVEFATA